MVPLQGSMDFPMHSASTRRETNTRSNHLHCHSYSRSQRCSQYRATLNDHSSCYTLSLNQRRGSHTIRSSCDPSHHSLYRVPLTLLIMSIKFVSPSSSSSSFPSCSYLTVRCLFHATACVFPKGSTIDLFVPLGIFLFLPRTAGDALNLPWGYRALPLASRTVAFSSQQETLLARKPKLVVYLSLLPNA